MEIPQPSDLQILQGVQPFGFLELRIRLAVDQNGLHFESGASIYGIPEIALQFFRDLQERTDQEQLLPGVLDDVVDRGARTGRVGIGDGILMHRIGKRIRNELRFVGNLSIFNYSHLPAKMRRYQL